jgi:uncharacterized protein YegL
MNKNAKKKNSGFRIAILFLLLIAGAGALLAGGVSPKLNNSIPPNQGQEFTPINPSPGAANQGKNSLQLETIGFKGCSGSVTVDFLLDRSGSMVNLTPTGQAKISRLKEAVLDLTSKFDNNAVIGIQSFSSKSIENDVNVSYYKDVKTLIVNQVNSYSADGQTPTHDALALSYSVLQNAVTRFPGRKFNFILISDGEPVPDSQDPRLFNPNPADQIKALGVNVFALAVYDSSQASNPKLSDLLKSIVSKPANYYEAQSADQIASLLQGISGKLCDSPATPSPSPAPQANNPTPQPSITIITTCGLGTIQFSTGNECGPGNCVMDGFPSAQNPCCPGVAQYEGSNVGRPDLPFYCDAKPVIYLYPEKPTKVSVKVTIPGKITVSIPKYEEPEGWQNVLAYPDGTLVYQGKKYSELFYETIQARTEPPRNGWAVKATDLNRKLTEITSSLGLNSKEQGEFLAYWLPRLKDLDKPYIFVSFFDPLIKDSVDKVDITPKPDNFIQFIMYFKGLDRNQKINPPAYPIVPQRKGFTAVEWGGILDY